MSLTVALIAAAAATLVAQTPASAAPPAGWVYVAALHSGKCLSIHNNSMTNGSPTHQWDCQSDNTAQWWIETPKDDGGWYSLRNYRTASNGAYMCLDVPHGSTTPGVRLQIWSCHGGANQLWQTQGSSAWGCVIFVNKATGQLVSVDGGWQHNGAVVLQWPWAGVPNQTWCRYR